MGPDGNALRVRSRGHDRQGGGRRQSAAAAGAYSGSHRREGRVLAQGVGGSVRCEREEVRLSSKDDRVRQAIEDVTKAMARNDFFAALGIERDAGADEIRRRYFALAKLLHPDRLRRTGLSEEERAAGARAWEFATTAMKVLTDPARRAQLEDALERGEDNPFTQSAEAKARVDEARSFYRRARKLLQGHAWAEAEKLLRAAVERQPDNVRYVAALGWAVFHNPAHPEDRRLEAARRLWEKVLELSPKNVDALYYLSLYYKAVGDVASQRRFLDAVLRFEPEHVDAQRELRLLRIRQANRREADDDSWWDRVVGWFRRSER